MSEQRIRVGVDIGGTFTDTALNVAGALPTRKVLTNYAQPEQAIIDGIVEVASQVEVVLDLQTNVMLHRLRQV